MIHSFKPYVGVLLIAILLVKAAANQLTLVDALLLISWLSFISFDTFRAKQPTTDEDKIKALESKVNALSVNLGLRSPKQ